MVLLQHKSSSQRKVFASVRQFPTNDCYVFSVHIAFYNRFSMKPISIELTNGYLTSSSSRDTNSMKFVFGPYDDLLTDHFFLLIIFTVSLYKKGIFMLSNPVIE